MAARRRVQLDRPEQGHPLAQPYPFRKECIIHELLHLKLPNHAKLFKALLNGDRQSPFRVLS